MPSTPSTTLEAVSLDLGDGLGLRSLDAGDLGEMVALFQASHDALAAQGRGAFLFPRNEEELAPLVAPTPNERLGVGGFTFGVFDAFEGGEMVGAGCAGLDVRFLPTDFAAVANVVATEDQVVEGRSLAVRPSHRRRGLARHLLEQRMRTTEELGRIYVTAMDVRNAPSLRNCAGRGMRIVDLHLSPYLPGCWSFCLANAHAPGLPFVPTPDAPAVRHDPIGHPEACAEALRAGAIGVLDADGFTSLRAILSAEQARDQRT